MVRCLSRHARVGGLGLLAATGLSGCLTDYDADGYIGTLDCDPFDPTIHDGAAEVCDGVDQDCDGDVDEGVQRTFYRDDDRDEFGAAGTELLACAAPDCYVHLEGDCDDTDPSVHPAVRESCDGRDENCDGEVDEGAAVAWRDQDGDGFGLETAPACEVGSGYATSRGDCDDTDPDIAPGADDPMADGIDQDCGGSDGLDPHVGLSPASYASIQAALYDASLGETIWVGPGHYLESEIYFGWGVRLISTDGPGATVIDAAQQGRVMNFTGGQTRESEMRGFTLTGGEAEQGAGLYLAGSSPTLRELVVTGNVAGDFAQGQGVAVFMADSAPLFSGCDIRGNIGFAGYGTGIYMTGSQPVFAGCDLSKNGDRLLEVVNSSPDLFGCRLSETSTSNHISVIRMSGSSGNLVWLDVSENASSGFGDGMIWMESSSPYIARCTVRDNWVEAGLAGIYMEGSSPTITRCTIAGNVPALGGTGGIGLVDSTPLISQSLIEGNYYRGIAMRDSAPVIESCIIRDNDTGGYGEDYGGGVWASSSSPVIRNTLITGNFGYVGGGGVAFIDSVGELRNSILAYNTTAGFNGETFPGAGGGIYLRNSSPTIMNSVVVSNGPVEGATPGPGGGIYLTGSESTPSIRNSIIAYNVEDNLFNNPNAPTDLTLSYSDLYNPAGLDNHNLPILPATNVTVEPGFLTYVDGLPADYHLSLESPLEDQGEPHILDPDGSRSDIGAYGGPYGDDWDLDADCYPDYFWPGELEDSPPGSDPDAYDADDLDPSVPDVTNSLD